MIHLAMDCEFESLYFANIVLLSVFIYTEQTNLKEE